MLKGHTSWYCLPGGADLCQGICLLIVGSWHVKEFAPLKVSTELLEKEAVACHICILGVPVTRRLLDHQVGVAVAQDPADADLFGQPEAMY